MTYKYVHIKFLLHYNVKKKNYFLFSHIILKIYHLGLRRCYPLMRLRSSSLESSSFILKRKPHKRKKSFFFICDVFYLTVFSYYT